MFQALRRQGPCNYFVEQLLIPSEPSGQTSSGWTPAMASSMTTVSFLPPMTREPILSRTTNIDPFPPNPLCCVNTITHCLYKVFSKSLLHRNSQRLRAMIEMYFIWMKRNIRSSRSTDTYHSCSDILDSSTVLPPKQSQSIPSKHPNSTCN